MTPAVFPYPPGPTTVPPGFTAPGSDYKLRVVLVLVSLIFFFLLYLALVVGTAVLTVVFLTSVHPAVGILLSAWSALFFLFLVKGLFKRRRAEKEARLEIFPREHPRLFEFIRRLCADTGAPLPHRVFVSYEVNAAVFYDHSLLSLLRPTPKNLLIGMGLVNMVNLSELKAVLAHEFGHFTQNSMKLGTYVYTANRIIGDMVFGRDWLDYLVQRMRRPDNRLAFVGWTIWGLLTGFRKILEGFFYAINFLNLSLSRQMEYNADLVAASVAGSDAIINSLARSTFANDALMQAFDELAVAADHELYSWDFFRHHTRAAAYLRRALKDPLLGERPPALPADATVTVEVFDPADAQGAAPMWAAHPPLHDRERNAKRHFLHCPSDPRSAWILFDNAQELSERVTWKFYRVVVKLKRDVTLADPVAVQTFIDDEHAETTYDPRYHGLYDGRFIRSGDPNWLARSVRDGAIAPLALERVHDGLYTGDFQKRMEEYAQLREELDTLTGLKDGRLVLRGADFTFRGRQYELGDVDRLFKKVHREVDRELNWMAELDRRVFTCHYQMALESRGQAARELLDRYQFHLALQELAGTLFEHQCHMEAALAFLSGKSQVTADQFIEVRDIFHDAHEALDKCLRTADQLPLPSLKNLRAGEPVGHFLLSKALVPQFGRSVRALSGKRIDRFLRQMGEVQDKLRRIHFKSLGAILTLQEVIARDWRACMAPAVPVAMAVLVEEVPTGRGAGAPGSALPVAVPYVPVSLACPGCRTTHQRLEAVQGRRVRCKVCQEVMLVRAPRRVAGDFVPGSKTPARTDPFAAPAPVRRRTRSEDEIAERSDHDGPTTAEVMGALAAALVFVAALGTLLVVYWASGPAPAASRPAPPVQPGRYLVDMQEFDVQPGQWPVAKGQCGNGQPIQVGGIPSPRGLGMHPPSAPAFAAAKFRLGKGAEVFLATVAINDTSTWCFSPATFTVLGDGKPLWQSQWIAHNHAHTQECRVDVKGVEVLELRVQCVNQNPGVHAVWVEPRVLP